MTITRHEPSKIYSKVVEANGFVFTAGITAADLKQDVKGQTAADPQGDRPPPEAVRHRQDQGGIRHHLGAGHPPARSHERSLERLDQGENLPGRACIEAKLADTRLLVEIAVVAAKCSEALRGAEPRYFLHRRFSTKVFPTVTQMLRHTGKLAPAHDLSPLIVFCAAPL